MTTLTLPRAPLPHPKSLAQQIFEPAQVNHEAVIFICETCERRGFFPPGRSPSIQWLSRRARAGSGAAAAVPSRRPCRAARARGSRAAAAAAAAAAPCRHEQCLGAGAAGLAGGIVLTVGYRPGRGRLQTCITCKVSCLSLVPRSPLPCFALCTSVKRSLL